MSLFVLAFFAGEFWIIWSHVSEDFNKKFYLWQAFVENILTFIFSFGCRTAKEENPALVKLVRYVWCHCSMKTLTNFTCRSLVAPGGSSFRKLWSSWTPFSSFSARNKTKCPSCTSTTIPLRVSSVGPISNTSPMNKVSSLEPSTPSCTSSCTFITWWPPWVPNTKNSFGGKSTWRGSSWHNSVWCYYTWAWWQHSIAKSFTRSSLTAFSLTWPLWCTCLRTFIERPTRKISLRVKIVRTIKFTTTTTMLIQPPSRVTGSKRCNDEDKEW